MHNPLLVPELRELLAAEDHEALREFCTSMHPATTADFISLLEPDEVRRVLLAVPPRDRALIFSHLDPEMEAQLAEALGRRELAEIVTHMLSDERVDLLQRLPEEQREALLPALATAEREDIRRLASYPEGTAGSVMSSDYAALSPQQTAAQAIERLRHEAPDKETIYYAYVVNEQRQLLGFVSLRDLILAPPLRKIADIMQRDVVFANVSDDQEHVAQLIAKYDLIALPIAGPEGTLVGIVTHDDVIDILRQEHTEDAEKFVGIAGEHEVGAYLRTSPWTHFKNRAGWVVGLAVLGLVSGLILHRFEHTIERLLLLAVYLPMIASTGGNTGSQSAMVIMRSLSTGEIRTEDLFRVLLKELSVALMLGAVLAALAFGKVLLVSGEAAMPAGMSLITIAAAIALALGVQVVTATLAGATLPLLVSRMGRDPAVVASPAITTLVDISGLLIYFGVVRLVLGI
ncbi:MAG: magnesium transporter [Planctomycetota bacterium]